MKTIDYPALCPALTVNDAAGAIDFYKAAFGAVELYRLNDPDSGKIGHAELTINGSMLMLADEYPEFNKSAKTLGGTPVKLSLMMWTLLLNGPSRPEPRRCVRPPTSSTATAARTCGIRSVTNGCWGRRLRR